MRFDALPQMMQGGWRPSALLTGDKGPLASGDATRRAAHAALRTLLLAPSRPSTGHSAPHGQPRGRVGRARKDDGRRAPRPQHATRAPLEQPPPSKASAADAGGEVGGGGGGGGGGKKAAGGDDDWESAVRAKLKKPDAAAAGAKAKAGATKGAAGGGDKQAAARQAQMAAEQETRARLLATEATLTRLVAIVTTICDATPSAAQPMLPQLLPELLPLQSTPAVVRGGGAPAWLPPLRSPRRLRDPYEGAQGAGGAVPAARHPTTEPFNDDKILSGYLAALLLDAAKALRSPLPPTGASLLLPLLRRALSDDSKGDERFQAIQESAFGLLCLHCSASLSLSQAERRLQSELLLMLMTRGERWQSTAADALHSLAGALAPTSVDEILEGAAFSEIGRVRAASARALANVRADADADGAPVAPVTAQRWLIRFDPTPTARPPARKHGPSTQRAAVVEEAVAARAGSATAGA